MTYPGGKSAAGVYQKIINLMPPHERYIEPFFGSGAIMRLKRPAPQNIGIELDPDVIKACPLLPYVKLIKGNGIAYLKQHRFTPRDLIYCDPPYLNHTRRTPKLYRFQLTDEEHDTLLATLTHLPCMVLISGYHSERYAHTLQDWNSTHFQTMTRGGTPATEWLWYNFPTPVALHDYRYLGDNFRERERIKRKTARWSARLQRMSILERQALLAVLNRTD